MRVKLEEVRPDKDSSFRILLTPGLNDLFYWHFHPEYEIVYVEGASGIRHIGDHISRYQDSDLVFIGPNIPHLNFDYGVRTECEQVVVQMKEDFLGKDFLAIPEFGQVRDLFRRAGEGLLFYGKTKTEVGERLKKLSDLPHFEQLMELLRIFHLLAMSDEVTSLHCRPTFSSGLVKKQERMQKIQHYLESNFQQSICIHDVAAMCHLSTAAFCRYFRKLTGTTFTDFLNQYRVNQAKSMLLQDMTVTATCYECGFESLSYFSKTFKKITGVPPARFRKNAIPGESRA